MTTNSNNSLSMNEIKAIAKKNIADAAGMTFTAPTGAVGTVLPNLSEHGKAQAEMTCVTEGCTETHIREASDWHQCGKCRTCSPKKSKSSGSGKGLRSIKYVDTDGKEQRLSEMRTEGLEGEQLALAEENNRLFNALKAQAEEQAKAQAEAEKAAREAKRAEEKAKHQAEAAAKKEEEIRARLERARAYAAERGLQISTAS